MKKIGLSILYCLTLSSWGVGFAGNGKYWQCLAEDDSHKQWVYESDYQRMAINQALDACKKQSDSPKTCKIAQENCDIFINGVSTRPMWKCAALDAHAQVYRSTIYSQKYDAVLGARAYCHHHSRVPDTCYGDVMMCNNLNEG